MRPLKKVSQWYQQLHPFSRVSFKLGLYLMMMFYIVGLVSRFSAPYVPNYHNAISLFRGCMEAAPASLAAGALAGLLGDLMMKNGKNNEP